MSDISNLPAFMVFSLLNRSKNCKRNCRKRNKTKLIQKTGDRIYSNSPKLKHLKQKKSKNNVNSIRRNRDRCDGRGAVPVNSTNNAIIVNIDKKRKSNKCDVDYEEISENELGSESECSSSEMVFTKYLKKKLDQPNNYFLKRDANGRMAFTMVPNNPLNGLNLFLYMIYPIRDETFMRKNWEKVPLFIKRKKSDYYTGLLQIDDVDRILRDNDIYYTKHLDVTICVNGDRKTMNPIGKAQPYAVWDYYSNNCTLRLSSPQLFLPNIHYFNVTLQDYFGCYVGANIYLTPPRSQGFAPHFDDIEAFILQIEGKKYWKLYKPRANNEKLPRYSSRDFKDDEIGEPTHVLELNPGDMLYLPRGYIHQCFTDSEHHSLHITVSVYQRNAWIDLLEKIIPTALKTAWQRDINYRKGLPLNFLHAAGFARNLNLGIVREEIVDTVKTLITKLPDYMDIDSAADELGNHFVHSSLPPYVTNEDKLHLQVGTDVTFRRGSVSCFFLYPHTKIKLVSPFVCRLSKAVQVTNDGEDIEYRVVYSTDNSKEYQGEDIKFLIISMEMVPTVQFLIRHYTQFVRICDLPHTNIDDLLQLMTDMWEVNLIFTLKPLK